MQTQIERPSALTSKDGGFIIAPDYAVEVAQMVSNLESAYEVADNGFEVVDLMREYFRGNLDERDVNEILYEEWPEAFPGLKRDA